MYFLRVSSDAPPTEATKYEELQSAVLWVLLTKPLHILYSLLSHTKGIAENKLSQFLYSIFVLYPYPYWLLPTP